MLTDQPMKFFPDSIHGISIEFAVGAETLGDKFFFFAIQILGHQVIPLLGGSAAFLNGQLFVVEFGDEYREHFFDRGAAFVVFVDVVLFFENQL